MAGQDIRWQQRFSNYGKVFCQLQSAVSLMQQRDLSELEKQGLIQVFKYSHELAWNVQKDFLESQGVTELFGSKSVAREAFNTGLIKNGAVWLKMIESRNLSSHTYNEQTTKQILTAIKEEYFQEFNHLNDRLEQLAKKNFDQ